MTSFVLFQERENNYSKEMTALMTSFVLFQEQENGYSKEMTALKTFGAALSAQIDSLNMVPSLFQDLSL